MSAQEITYTHLKSWKPLGILHNRPETQYKLTGNAAAEKMKKYNQLTYVAVLKLDRPCQLPRLNNRCSATCKAHGQSRDAQETHKVIGTIDSQRWQSSMSSGVPEQHRGTHDGCPHYQNAEITALDDVLGDVELTVFQCEICRVLVRYTADWRGHTTRGQRLMPTGGHFIDLYYRLYSL